jgi:hypothetical protein
MFINKSVLRKLCRKWRGRSLWRRALSYDLLSNAKMPNFFAKMPEYMKNKSMQLDNKEKEDGN